MQGWRRFALSQVVLRCNLGSRKNLDTRAMLCAPNTFPTGGCAVLPFAVPFLEFQQRQVPRSITVGHSRQLWGPLHYDVRSLLRRTMKAET